MAQDLTHIYKGPSFSERARFDDGGGVGSYEDYAMDGTGLGGGDSVSNTPIALNSDEAPNTNLTPDSGMNQAVPVSMTYQGDPSSSGSSKGAASAASSGVGALLKALGLGGGNTNNVALAGALTGLLSAAGTAKQNAAAGKLPTLPTLPGSSSAGYGPSGGYGFQNYAGANPSTPGLGYAPVQQVAGKPAPSYYTYGQGPQQQQFQQVNGGAPITPITMARGGHVPKFAMGGMNNTGVQPFAPPPPQVPQPQQPPQMPGGMPQRPMTPPAPAMPQRPPAGPSAPQPQSFMAQRMAQARAPQMPGAMPQPSPMPMRPHPIMGRASGGFVSPQTNPTPAPAIGMAQSQLTGSAPSHGIQVHSRGPAAAGHTPGMATGGALSQPGVEGPGVSRHVTGPGDGTSDSIPARLANGEYVIDAQAVSMLGNGDNSAGAKRLDEFRKNLRQHKGGALSRGQMAPDAKPVEHYMGKK